METQEIMDLALRLAKMKTTPADSAIHVPGRKINKIFLCVDASPSELIIAKNLGCDAVITHHPLGKSLLNFHLVFDRHVEYMLEYGIPLHIAEQAVRKLKERIALRSHATIYTHTVAAAEKLEMPLVNIHLPCDELMRQTILAHLRTSKINVVSDLKEVIEKIPEFRNSETEIQIPYGDSSSKTGKYALVIAAGTNGGYYVAKAYFDYGIATVIYLHINGEDLTRLKEDKVNGNLVILGHLAGDSIGLNLLSDELEKDGIEVVKLGILSNK